MKKVLLAALVIGIALTSCNCGSGSCTNGTAKADSCTKACAAKADSAKKVTTVKDTTKK